MKFEVFCAGQCRDDGLISQVGGCGVVLKCVDDIGRIQWREFGFGLSGSSQLLCDIQAVRLALSSIIPAGRSHEVTLNLENPQVATFLTAPEPSIAVLQLAAKYRHQIAEMRRWYGYYTAISIQVHAGSLHFLDKARELAQAAMESQKASDSLTYQEDSHGK
jgi:hypothetical protein